MLGDAEQALTLMWLFSWIPHSMSHSPPGKPRITRCRSPEKETFTCWWEPGSTGGLSTTYHLYYRKENSVEVFECPDYHKVGNNSCYFDKRHTSIWIIYNITVVASNTLGKTYSESVEVDVMDIVQPHPPENVNVTLVQLKNSPYVLVQWQAPRKADTSSGWVTIKYEVRLKMQNSVDEDGSNWEAYNAGKQLEYSIYSPQPGVNYVIQVRCKLDQGFWSEWSPYTVIQIPDNMSDTPNAVTIAVAIAIIVFLLTAGVLTLKTKLVKHFFLPPVPVPKISGLDTRLLKSGKSEEIFSALTTPGYPQITQLQVEYLVISDCDVEVCAEKAYHEDQKEENCPTENSFQIICTGSQDLNTSIVFNQLTAASCVLEEPQHSLYLNCKGSPAKAEDPNAQIIPSKPFSITSAGLTGYIEVDEGKQDQRHLPKEDYSVVSDIISHNILILQDSIPIQGHQEVKCDKTALAEETRVVIEPLGYLKTMTFSNGS